MAANTNKQLRQNLAHSKRIVVKLGTRVLVNSQGKPNLRRIAHIVDQLIQLKKQGKEVVLVSSGAIGAGMKCLKMSQRPTTLPDLQMAASVGQTALLAIYNDLFAKGKIQISQVLLTHDDLRHRGRHLNARNTLMNLMHHNVIPIINENDVVAVDEIKVGDNDVLSALVSVLVDADTLILLTSPNGLLDQNQKRIACVNKIDKSVLGLVKDKTDALSTGGMATKLQAAKIATDNGTQTIIARGVQRDIITQILAGKDKGTLFCAKDKTVSRRKSWISFFHRSQGDVIIDTGAEKALIKQNKSLLPIGIKSVQGHFTQGAMINILNNKKQVIAKGLTDFSSDEIQKIKGKHSRQISKILGGQDYDVVIHKDNLVIMDI